MRESIREIALCPICWSDRLRWNEELSARCESCGGDFPCIDNIWHAIVPDESWKPVLQDTVSLFMDFTVNRDTASKSQGQRMQTAQEQYARQHEADRDRLFWDIWDQLPIKSGERILEIGGGNLRAADRLRERGHSVFAIEPVPEFLRLSTYGQDPAIGKMCGSASRLPFRCGVFDVVFCQAMLHHVDNIEAILREMSRVLRPGGLIAAFTEPVSAMFRNINRTRETVPEPSFDMGLHEEIPPFAAYWNGFRRSAIQNIHAIAKPEACQLPHRLARFGFLRKRLPQGAETAGPRMHFRHRLTHGEVTIYGIRGEKAIPHPPVADSRAFPFSAADYIHKRDRKHLVQAWISLLDIEETPQTIEVGRNDLFELRRGFSRRERDMDGTLFKWLFAQGAFFLRVRPGNACLTAQIKFPDGEDPFPVQALMDSEPLPPAKIESSPLAGWTGLAWELPSIGEESIHEFILRAGKLDTKGELPTSVKVNRVRIQ